MTETNLFKFHNIFSVIFPLTSIVVTVESNLMYQPPAVVFTSSGHDTSLMCLVQVFYVKKVPLVSFVTMNSFYVRGNRSEANKKGDKKARCSMLFKVNNDSKAVIINS